MGLLPVCGAHLGHSSSPPAMGVSRTPSSVHMKSSRTVSTPPWTPQYSVLQLYRSRSPEKRKASVVFLSAKGTGLAGSL